MVQPCQHLPAAKGDCTGYWMHVQYSSLMEYDMRPTEFRYVYRPSRVRLPRWMSLVWGWL